MTPYGGNAEIFGREVIGEDLAFFTAGEDCDDAAEGFCLTEKWE